MAPEVCRMGLKHKVLPRLLHSRALKKSFMEEPKKDKQCCKCICEVFLKLYLTLCDVYFLCHLCVSEDQDSVKIIVCLNGSKCLRVSLIG